MPTVESGPGGDVDLGTARLRRDVSDRVHIWSDNGLELGKVAPKPQVACAIDLSHATGAQPATNLIDSKLFDVRRMDGHE